MEMALTDKQRDRLYREAQFAAVKAMKSLEKARMYAQHSDECQERLWRDE